ncbi:MAG: hypothetical protein ACREXU_02740 [Gammaproteobacteria bacterium]
MSWLRRVIWVLGFALFHFGVETLAILGARTPAIGLCKYSLRIFPRNRATLLSQLGSVHERFNEVEVAIEYYGEAAKLRPNDGSIDVELGLAYERTGR